MSRTSELVPVLHHLSGRALQIPHEPKALEAARDRRSGHIPTSKSLALLW